MPALTVSSCLDKSPDQSLTPEDPMSSSGPGYKLDTPTLDRARFVMRDIGRYNLKVTNRAPYAKYHNFGQGVPQRRMTGFSPAERKAVRDAIAQGIETGETGIRALERAKQVVLEAIDSRFESESDYTGAPWQPLKLSTIKSKARRNLQGGILQASGLMRKSFEAEIR